jgi:anaerobic ribonucleoside-triphosphate reductase activating protein
MMNYATIKTCDIANGPGVRTSLFVSGCTHHCKNCFNREAWDFAFGASFDAGVQQQILDECRPGYITGLTLLGGEPMEPVNQRALLPFVRRFRAAFPTKTVWCYSGYTWEQLTGDSRARCEVTDDFLREIDVLVDGPFVQELHDITLRFKGSSNQRIIDVKQSLSDGKIVLWQDKPLYSTHRM